MLLQRWGKVSFRDRLPGAVPPEHVPCGAMRVEDTPEVLAYTFGVVFVFVFCCPHFVHERVSSRRDNKFARWENARQLSRSESSPACKFMQIIIFNAVCNFMQLFKSGCDLAYHAQTRPRSLTSTS